MEFSIAKTFINSLENLSNDEKKVVKRKAFDLQMNPATPGMQFHRINGIDPNFWSIRVNDDIRIIVHKTDMEMMICYVDHHEPAYQWAERRKVDRNSHQGVTRIVEIQEIVEENTICYFRSELAPFLPVKKAPKSIHFLPSCFFPNLR